MKLINRNQYNRDNLFDSIFMPTALFRTAVNSFMRADISKRKGNYVFDIDIPGYKKDDIKVQLNDGYLTVKVDALRDNMNCSEEECEWLHQERFNGEYYRSFYLGCSNETKANATYHNGVLTVVVPMDQNTEKNTSKYINVE